MSHPVLWSFRRCPYAMRARLAVMSSGLKVELREILLRDKPDQFLIDSESATVPALRDGESVFDESLDIMVWALQQNDPSELLDMPEEGWGLIAEADGPFKEALDHTKYISRYPELNEDLERAKAAEFLKKLEVLLQANSWLLGDKPTLADYAILPFVRQFANTDRAWFDAQPWPELVGWLDRFLDSRIFLDIMSKYVPWSEGDKPVWFGKLT